MAPPGPTGPKYHNDWIRSNTSNVHAANDRAWFTEFTSFKSHAGHFAFPGQRLEVTGVGTVSLTLRIDALDPLRTHTITLYNILLTPKAVCNIFATQATKDYTLPTNEPTLQNVVLLRDSRTKDTVGLLQQTVLLSLWLVGKPQGHSSLEAYKMYYINATWSPQERLKYEAHVYAQKCAATEDAWVKARWGGWAALLTHFGWAVAATEDRAEAWKLVKWLMTCKKDGKEV